MSAKGFERETCLIVFAEYQLVTDTQTDGRTNGTDITVSRYARLLRWHVIKAEEKTLVRTGSTTALKRPTAGGSKSY